MQPLCVLFDTTRNILETRKRLPLLRERRARYVKYTVSVASLIRGKAAM